VTDAFLAIGVRKELYQLFNLQLAQAKTKTSYLTSTESWRLRT